MWTGLLPFALTRKPSAERGSCAVQRLAGPLYLGRQRCVEQFLSPSWRVRSVMSLKQQSAGQPPADLNVVLGSGCDRGLHLPLSLVLSSSSETGVVIQ